MDDVDKQRYLEIWSCFRYDPEKTDKEKIKSWQTVALETISQLKLENVALVADTAAGKTIIALMTAVALNWRTIFFVPQKILAVQHQRLFFSLLPDQLNSRIITGDIVAKKRFWNNLDDRIIFATPQLIPPLLGHSERAIDFSKFQLIILDEFHRAKGKYAYVLIVKIAEKFNIKILSLSASPGGTEEKIRKIKNNIATGKFILPHIATPYRKKELIIVDPDETILMIDKLMKELTVEVLFQMKKIGLALEADDHLNNRQRRQIREQLASMKKHYEYYSGLSFLAKYEKIYHAHQTVLTESFFSFLCYVEKIKKEDKTRAGKEILSSGKFNQCVNLAEVNLDQHVKVEKFLKKLISWAEIKRNGLVFVSQKNTATYLLKKMNSLGIPAETLFGGKGKNINQQENVLKKLARKELPFILATSVIEEGINVPEVDAIFHYSIPRTEISRIQRDGRTGRLIAGNIFYISLNHPMDKGMYWKTFHEERSMRKIIQTYKADENFSQIQPLKKFVQLNLFH